MTKLTELIALIETKGAIFAVHHYGVPAITNILGKDKETIVMYVNKDGSCLLRNPFNKNRTIKSEITEDMASAILIKHQTFLDSRVTRQAENVRIQAKRAEKMIKSNQVGFKPSAGMI